MGQTNKATNKARIQRNELFPVNLRLRKSLDRAVEIEAATRDISKQQIVEAALLAYLNLEFEIDEEVSQ